jgi:hypothetical protein
MARRVQPLVGMVSDPKARSASNAGMKADSHQAETPPQGEGQGEAQRKPQQNDKKPSKKENPDA